MVCMERERGVLYVPCNHLAVCAECDLGIEAASMPCPMIAMPGAPVGRAPPRAGRAHDGYFDAVFAGLASLFEAFDFVSVVFAGLASVFLDESPELSVEGDAAFLSASAFFL